MHLTALAAVACTFASLSSAKHGFDAAHALIHARAPAISDYGLSPQSINPALTTVPLAPRDLPIGTCNKDTPCTNKACCGSNGLCGYSPTECGAGCTSNCDAKAQCGQYAPEGKQKCPLNVCCSEFGYCGSTDDFCKWKHCDTKWGGCGDPKRPSCKGGNSVGKRTVGYYESWTSTRKCQKVEPEDLNLSGFTHLNFAFAFFDPKTFQIAPMDSNSGSLYNRFTGLKSKAHGLQTWISVGGWSFTDPGPTRSAFSDMAGDAANRKSFIDGLTKFMDTYGFDGVDLDWEYPVADDRGGKPDDQKNYVQLAKEMKAAFNGKYGLSVTLPTSYWYLQGFDLAGIQASVDWFNLMSYDLHGTWDAQSKFVGSYIAPHTNDTEIDLGLDLLWRAGVTADKVVMGQGWYGRSFTLKDPKCNTPNGVCEFSGGAKAGPCSDASGILDLQEINDIIREKKLKPEYDQKANVKWITWDNDQWVSFDDDQTFKAKKDFANDRCLGGQMIWAMDQVDQTAPNGLGPAPNITPEQKKGVDKMGSDLNAGATCYTSKCSEKCKKGFHEVAQMTGQPGDLSTQPRCGLDKHKKQQHESLCCPSGTTMGKCEWRGWRGVGLSCNSGCPDGETEVAKNTNHIAKKVDQSCTGGLQSYCCKGFAPPPPPKKKKSIKEKIKDAFDDAGKKIKQGFEKFGDDIKNFAEGVLVDIGSKLVCRVVVPGIMAVAEVAEDVVPVAGEIADAAEIAATPAIIAACQKGMDKLASKAKSKIKPASPKAPVSPRQPPKPHDPPKESGKPQPKPNDPPKESGKPQPTPKPSDKPKSSSSRPSSSSSSRGTKTLSYGPLPTVEGTTRGEEANEETAMKRSSMDADSDESFTDIVERAQESDEAKWMTFKPDGVTKYKVGAETYPDAHSLWQSKGWWFSDTTGKKGAGSPKLTKLTTPPDNNKEPVVTEHVFEKQTALAALMWMSKGKLPDKTSLPEGAMPVKGLFDQSGIFNQPWPANVQHKPKYGTAPLNTLFGCLGHKNDPARSGNENTDNLQVLNAQVNGLKNHVAALRNPLGAGTWGSSSNSKKGQNGKQVDANDRLNALGSLLNVFNYYNNAAVQKSYKDAYTCIRDEFWPAFADVASTAANDPKSGVEKGAKTYKFADAFKSVIQNHILLSADKAKENFNSRLEDAETEWRKNPSGFSQAAIDEAKKDLASLKSKASLIKLNVVAMMG